MPSSMSRSLLAGLVSLAFVAPASAAVTLNFVETGAGVVGSFSGNLSLSGLTLVGGGGQGAEIFPSKGEFATAGPAVVTYRGSFMPVAYGTGGLAGPSSTSGDALRMNVIPDFGSLISVPANYVAGSPLAGTMTFFAGSTLANFGMTPGSYITALPGGDSITVNVIPVPEPSTYALMLAGLGVVGYMARRRRGQAAGHAA